MSPIATKFLGIDDLTTERSFDYQATCAIDEPVLDLLFYILSMGAYTTRHWQTTGRVVHELTVRTVVYLFEIDINT